MNGILIRYNVPNEVSAESWPKQMDAFAYVQRDKQKNKDGDQLLSTEEIRSHAIRYINSLKENAHLHLVEQRNGEIEHFSQREKEVLDSKRRTEAQLINLEEIRVILHSMSGLNVEQAFSENASKLLSQLMPYAKDENHPVIMTSHFERHIYSKSVQNLEAVLGRILRQKDSMKLDIERTEKLWIAACKQEISKVEKRINRFSMQKIQYEKKIEEISTLKQQNVEAKERLDHAVDELDRILEILES